MKSLIFSTTLTLLTIASMTNKAQSYEVLSVDELKNTVQTIYHPETDINVNSSTKNEPRLIPSQITIKTNN